ncbi:Wdr64 [Symbiodinium natans]|uniref:Wdr64 protein n=1 Tax=Symbiodinium natans TaxID=878477 RepID=A0A812RAW3_9DINO|nr:Wdr64 [Symbiodinium natans]
MAKKSVACEKFEAPVVCALRSLDIENKKHIPWAVWPFGRWATAQADQASMGLHVQLVVLLPSIAMLLGSMAVFVCRLPDKIQAAFQMFSAGLLISAVGNELLPLLTPPAGPGPVTSTLALVVGFAVGLIFMFGLGYLTESMEDDEEDEEPKHKRTYSDIETALLGVNEDDRSKAKDSFVAETAEIRQEVQRLQTALQTGCQNGIDEILHGLEYRVHRATRVLFVRTGIDDGNLKRMREHGQELHQASEKLAGFDNFQKAKDDLKAFQACLEHLHGHAERVPHFRRWKARSKPTQEMELPEELPLTLVAAVTVDAAVDGLLIGLSYAASPSAGIAMAAATSIEMGFLGLSFCASLQNATRSALKIVVLALLPPVVLVLSGEAGHRLGRMCSENPEVFIAFISFSIVALLFLVTQELLIEAQEVARGSKAINAVFFVGLLAGILLEKFLG